MAKQERFTDQNFTIADFTDEILVVCPKCGARAVVAPLPGCEVELFARRRLTCAACGLQREKQPRSAILGCHNEPVDSFFQETLWLVARHGHDVFWAYNIRHLEYIEAFVRSTLRTHEPNSSGCCNRSMMSRLPQWIKNAKNRKRVLKMIEDLKTRGREKRPESAAHHAENASPLMCEHLRELEQALIDAGMKITHRGQTWSNAKPWVYFDCVIDLARCRTALRFAECVENHIHRGTHDGTEQGFYCRKCRNGVMGHHPEAHPSENRFP